MWGYWVDLLDYMVFHVINYFFFFFFFRKYLGTLPRSMFTLFKAMTNRLDWNNVGNPLSAVHSTEVAMFVLCVCIVFFALTNVVTGVLCLSPNEGVQYERDLVSTEVLANKEMCVERTRELFKSMFARLDTENTGCISMTEFLAVHGPVPRLAG